MKKIMYFSLFLTVLVITAAGCEDQPANNNLEINNNEVEQQRVSDLEKSISEEMEPIPLEYTEVDMSNWKTYRNDDYGFEFKYPEEGKMVSVIESPNIFSVQFAPAPANNPDPGFNAVSRRKLDVIVRDIDKQEERCSTTSEWGTRNLLVKADDYMFCYSEADDGTAGTMYHLYYYKYYNDESVINLNFTIPEVNCGAYDDDAGCVGMDEEEETELFKQIVSTFKVK